MTFIEIFNYVAKVARPAHAKVTIAESMDDVFAEIGLDSLDGLVMLMYFDELYGIADEVSKEWSPKSVQELHERGQVGLGEVLGPHAGIEAVEAEVDGVGAVFYGRAGAVPVTGRSQQFGQTVWSGGSRFGHEANTVSGARAAGKTRRNRTRGPPSNRLLLCAGTRPGAWCPYEPLEGPSLGVGMVVGHREDALRVDGRRRNLDTAL